MEAYGIYDMELFETKAISISSMSSEDLIRVPGGWLYRKDNGECIGSTFIPYNEEFKQPNRS